LGLVLAAASAVLAQTSQPASAPATIPYIDTTFGFEMQVPADWRYDRTRFRGPGGSIGVLRGEGRGVGQALQILIFRSFELVSFDRWLASFETQLATLHKPNKVSEKSVQAGDQPGQRPRATLVVDPKTVGSRITTHYLCIPFDPNTVWVLVFAGNVADDAGLAALRTEYDQIAASVRVLYDPLEAEQIAAAFERGLTVLKELNAGAVEVPLDSTERYYEIFLADKPIGYLLRWIRRETQGLNDPRFTADKRRDGLRVHEESWRFPDDGTVRCTELNMFSSFDRRSELIENRTTQVPAPDVQPQRLYIELDQCVREDKSLFSSFSTNLDPELPPQRPLIPIGPRYLDLVWVRLLPRVLLRVPAETYAFAIYDLPTRALTVHTIRPLGPCELPGQGGSGYAFETRDGFAGPASRVVCDAEGNVLRVECGGLVLAQATRAEVERKYAARRDPARQRMELPAPTSRP
jgi:hypothetical protein